MLKMKKASNQDKVSKCQNPISIISFIKTNPINAIKTGIDTITKWTWTYRVGTFGIKYTIPLITANTIEIKNNVNKYVISFAPFLTKAIKKADNVKQII